MWFDSFGLSSCSFSSDLSKEINYTFINLVDPLISSIHPDAVSILFSQSAKELNQWLSLTYRQVYSDWLIFWRLSESYPDMSSTCLVFYMSSTKESTLLLFLLMLSSFPYPRFSVFQRHMTKLKSHFHREERTLIKYSEWVKKLMYTSKFKIKKATLSSLQ